MRRPPFERISDLNAVFHTEQYTFLLDHLANAALQSDYLVAICGADGCGKTTLLNRFLSSLGDDICVARFDESSKSVREFYCEFLRQLGFHEIDGKPDELRRISREFIVNRGMASEPVVLVIDNAHLISPIILEQLRWLSAIRVDEVRVLSSVLAGNSDLMRILDSAAMSQFAYNNYIRFHVRAFSEAETIDYVWSRLNYADCSDRLTISSDAQPLIHRFSGGVPRMINILCDSVLQDACTAGTTEITGEMLRNVAEKRHLVPHVLPYQGRGRRRSDPDFGTTDAHSDAGDPIQAPTDEDAAADHQEMFKPGHGDDTGQQPRQGYDAGTQRQLARLSSKLGDLKGENRRLAAKISSRDAELDELRNALQSQATRNAELERAYDDKSGEYETLSNSLLEQQAARERSDQTSRHLVEALRQDQQELAELRAKLADAGQDSRDLAELRLEADELNRKLADAARDRETIARLEQDAEELRDQLADAERNRETIARLEQDTEELRDKLADAERNRETIARLEQDTEELRDQLADAERNRETIARLEQDAEELRQELAAAGRDKEAIARLEAEAEELRARVDQTNEDKETIARLSAELDELHAKLAVEVSAADAVAKMQDELGQLRDERDRARDELSRLQADMSDALEAVGTLELELESAAAAANLLQHESQVSEQQRAGQSTRIQDLESVVEAHEQEVEALLSRIDELETDKLATAEELAQFASLEAYAGDCEAQLEALRSELEQARDRKSDVAPATDTDMVRTASATAEALIEESSDEPTHVPIRTIEVFHGDKLQQVLRIAANQRRVMIGRDADNELILDSNFISRHHAILSLRDDGTACIEDLNSLNGIIVNKTKLARSDLGVGDVVIVGDFCLLPGPA